MKNFFLGSFVTLAALVLGGFLYLRLGFAEVRADLAPSKLEDYVMRSVVHASVRREAPEQPSPVQPTEENLITGGKLFLSNCSGCHGSPLNTKEDMSDSLFPRIPQLAKVGTEYTEAQVFWVAKHGVRRTGMFANGRFYPDRDLWLMTAFVKRIQNLPPHVIEELANKEGTK